MNEPSFDTAHVAADTTSLSTIVPVGDLGLLHVNAFVVHADMPVLVDTGPAVLREPFLAALGRTSTRPTSATSG